MASSFIHVVADSGISFFLMAVEYLETEWKETRDRWSPGAQEGRTGSGQQWVWLQ